MCFYVYMYLYVSIGRKMEDTKPLVDIMKGKVEHFVYMSSAGVYKKNVVMPHIEGDETDIKSRHAGKLDTEKYLIESGIPFTSIRYTYIHLYLYKYVHAYIHTHTHTCVQHTFAHTNKHKHTYVYSKMYTY